MLVIQWVCFLDSVICACGLYAAYCLSTGLCLASYEPSRARAASLPRGLARPWRSHQEWRASRRYSGTGVSQPGPAGSCTDRTSSQGRHEQRATLDTFAKLQHWLSKPRDYQQLQQLPQLYNPPHSFPSPACQQASA